jgi:hypothetical protein
MLRSWPANLKRNPVYEAPGASLRIKTLHASSEKRRSAMAIQKANRPAQPVGALAADTPHQFALSA